MKQITIEVDEGTWGEYDNFKPEAKTEFINNMTKMLKNIIREKRSLRIKKLIDELKDEPDQNIDPEVLLTLLQAEG
jgi:ATP-dependent protease HslVU (ClpYQ) ATPase subunit